MDNVSGIEKELNKLGCANATYKSETQSKVSEKGQNQISTQNSEKNALSTKSGEASGTRQTSNGGAHLSQDVSMNGSQNQGKMGSSGSGLMGAQIDMRVKQEQRKDSGAFNGNQMSDRGSHHSGQSGAGGSHQFYGSNKPDQSKYMSSSSGHPSAGMMLPPGQSYSNSPFPNMSGQRLGSQVPTIGKDGRPTSIPPSGMMPNRMMSGMPGQGHPHPMFQNSQGGVLRPQPMPGAPFPIGGGPENQARMEMYRPGPYPPNMMPTQGPNGMINSSPMMPNQLARIPQQIPPRTGNFVPALPQPSVSAEKIPQPILQNIVSTANLGMKLDLRKIAMNCRNAEYNPKRFAAVIMRIRDPKTTALIFSSGKMVCTGAKSEEFSRDAAKKYSKAIKKVGFEDVNMQDFKIQNIVGSCDVGFPISLESLSSTHEKFSQYEPEIFPGLIYRMATPKIVLLIFASGKIVLTGAKNKNDIKEAYENIYPVLKKYKKKNVKPVTQQSQSARI